MRSRHRFALGPLVARRIPVLLVAILLAGPLVSRADDALERTSESGPVRATVRVTPDAPRIGDTLHLELEVTAEPGVELLMPEFGEALDRFAIVDFAPSEGLDADGNTFSRQRYSLQPSRSGQQSIPPLLVEFIDHRSGRPSAPDDADAYELLTERLEFNVASVLSSDDSLELDSSLGSLGPRRTPAPPLWPWLLAAGVLLLAASPFAIRWASAKLADRRRQSAYEVARLELDALLYGPRPMAEAIDGFYVSLSGVIRRYLEDHFGLHSPEQTTDEFLDTLARSGELGSAHRDLLRRFLEVADLVKFAHHIPDESGVSESIELAQRFLAETREMQHA